MTLGSDWLKETSTEANEQTQLFLEKKLKNEQAAQAELGEIRRKFLKDGMQSCKINDSQMLSIEITAECLNTQAMLQFTKWLNDEDLAVSVISHEGKALLTFVPSSS